MKEDEKEEAIRWLDKLTKLYEQTKFAINETTNLKIESDAKDWDKTFSNENCLALMQAIEPAKELPKPKHKELRKLRKCYIDLLAACLKAGHLYLKSYYDGNLSRFQYSKMIFGTSFASGLLETFSSDLDKVFQEIK